MLPKGVNKKLKEVISMTKNGKMTKKEMFNAMLAKYEFTAEEKEFINHELELLAKKNSAEKGQTKTQKENAVLAEKLLEVMEPNVLYSVTELCKLMGIESNQKVTHLATALVADDKLVRTVEKRRAYYSLA